MNHLELKYQAFLAQARRTLQHKTVDMQVGLQILSLAASMQREQHALLHARGLSEGRLSLLFLLKQNPQGLSPADLASQACISRPTVSGLLDRLEARKLVARRLQPSDRRTVIVTLTPKGKKLCLDMVPPYVDWLSSSLGHLPEHRKKELAELLSEVLVTLQHKTSKVRPATHDDEPFHAKRSHPSR